MYTEPKVNKNHDFNDHNIVTIERVNKLLFQSIDTLEEILKNQELPTQERATVALKIIEMTGLLSQKNNYSPALTFFRNAEDFDEKITYHHIGIYQYEISTLKKFIN